MDNLPGNWDAAGSMFRAALESALKCRFPEISGSLKERIDEVAKAHELTPALAEWAHKVRLGGNDAVHSDVPFSRTDAQDMYAFTDVLLRYLFTLPGM